MKQMPRLTLAAPPLVIPIRAGLVCGSRVRQSGNTTANQDCSYELLVIIGEMYYAGAALILFIPSSRAPLSSVKSNEQMLLSCWSQHDRRSRWQAHPSAEGK